MDDIRQKQSAGSILAKILKVWLSIASRTSQIIGSMVINQSYINQQKGMLNPYNMAMQPYFIFQTPGTIIPSFIFQQNPSFIFSQIIHPNALPNAISFGENTMGQIRSFSEVTSSEIKPENGSMTNLSPEIPQRKNIIKEKLIKKPANRPATYLTERKYYLAQPLQEQQNQNRKLRPRNLKKRSHKTSEKPTHSIQKSLGQKGKDDLSKDDCGLSQNCSVLKPNQIQKGPQQMVEKTMKSSESSSSRDDSK